MFSSRGLAVKLFLATGTSGAFQVHADGIAHVANQPAYGQQLGRPGQVTGSNHQFQLFLRVKSRHNRGSCDIFRMARISPLRFLNRQLSRLGPSFSKLAFPEVIACKS